MVIKNLSYITLLNLSQCMMHIRTEKMYHQCVLCAYTRILERPDLPFCDFCETWSPTVFEVAESTNISEFQNSKWRVEI